MADNSNNNELISCRECSGWGKGLVGESGYCNYCTRVLKLNHDPEACDMCCDGYFDITPSADGGVHKKVLRPGGEEGSYKFPIEGCPTFVQHIGRLLDGSIFDTTRDVVNGKHVGGTDDPFEFQLKRDEVIKGWDIGVGTMVMGEVSRFVIRSDYAYGKVGFPPKVEPLATLEFEIELVRFDKALPKFPSQESIAANKKKRAEEERKMMEDNPPPSTDEKVASAEEEKQKGNELFAAGDFDGARKQYDTAFVHIFIHKDEWEHITSAEDKVKINAMKLPLYLNRSICKIKQGKFKDAEWDVDQAILLDPESVKGHYRRGLTFSAKLEAELHKEETKEFWECTKAAKFAEEANNSYSRALELAGGEDRKISRSIQELRRQEVRLKRFTRQYEEEQKRLYKDRILNKLMETNSLEQQREQQEQQEHMYDDMPGLE